MGVPFAQMLRVGAHLIGQKLARREKFALLVQLEPLFSCNLACTGCGKIEHPKEILKRRIGVEEAIAGIVDSGAPMVSIAGGEPLLHPEIDAIVAGLLERGKFVYLCTNGLLMRRSIDRFAPAARFSWVVHIDGLRERHDQFVGRTGVFDECVRAIREAKRRRFRVATNTTVFSQDSPQAVREVLDFLNDELEVDQMMISPGFAYGKAPDRDHFLSAEHTKKLFREVFAGGHRRRWRLSHSPLFLDFLEGKVDLDCTAWAIPCFSVLGWQRPCYLLSDGHVGSYRELLETTDWERFGRGRDERCWNCMAHCGYEPTAVLASMRSLRESLRGVRDARVWGERRRPRRAGRRPG